MPTSTSTLLEVTNLVLDTISEKQVGTTDDNRISKKAKRALVTALAELETASWWTWAYVDGVPANSWSTNVATVQDCRVIKRVMHNGCRVSQVPPAVLATYTPYAYSVPAYGPTVFSVKSTNQFGFDSYPTTTEEQAKVLFSYFKTVTFPALDTDVFPIPQNFIQLLVFKAVSDLCVSHMLRTDLYSIYNQRYQELLRQVIATEATPNNTLNFYGNNRSQSQW